MKTVDKRIRAGLLLFWALYFSIVLVSNSADALSALSLLPSEWHFVSGNYGLIQKVVSLYEPPAWLAGFMFAGVILWEAVGAILFWRAFLVTLRDNPKQTPLLHAAFGITIGLWAMFILADEVFLVYLLGGISSTHFNLLLAELATFILIRLLD
ncbi:hypothetical protein GO730_08425 [Spirosoma sp. HMF3257]|uniref:DUF2165 domain-containing protein n=1 Tax=Spirosoma telluris TaxID=2183553 RepID=A0A327NGA3_9BACT|nr:hypothetical protein [Spirosoma telluris]RAI74312.1 hypothetical protein HMF3257_08335 [Spirosoma telluris]